MPSQPIKSSVSPIALAEPPQVPAEKQTVESRPQLGTVLAQRVAQTFSNENKPINRNSVPYRIGRSISQPRKTKTGPTL